MIPRTTPKVFTTRYPGNSKAVVVMDGFMARNLRAARFQRNRSRRVLILSLLRLRRVLVERALHERNVLQIEERDVNDYSDNQKRAGALHVFEHFNIQWLAPHRLNQAK